MASLRDGEDKIVHRGCYYRFEDYITTRISSNNTVVQYSDLFEERSTRELGPCRFISCNLNFQRTVRNCLSLLRRAWCGIPSSF